MEAHTEAVVLHFIGNELVPSELLDFRIFKTGLNFTDSGDTVGDSIIALHAFKDESSELVHEVEGQMVSCFLLLKRNVSSLCFFEVETLSLVRSHDIRGS